MDVCEINTHDTFQWCEALSFHTSMTCVSNWCYPLYPHYASLYKARTHSAVYSCPSWYLHHSMPVPNPARYPQLCPYLHQPSRVEFTGPWHGWSLQWAVTAGDLSIVAGTEPTQGHPSTLVNTRTNRDWSHPSPLYPATHTPLPSPYTQPCTSEIGVGSQHCTPHLHPDTRVLCGDI